MVVLFLLIAPVLVKFNVDKLVFINQKAKNSLNSWLVSP